MPSLSLPPLTGGFLRPCRSVLGCSISSGTHFCLEPGERTTGKVTYNNLVLPHYNFHGLDDWIPSTSLSKFRASMSDSV